MSDKLFQLIQSLSKSEKRYFKLYAQRFSENEETLKLRLFDLVSKLKTYDEAAVLKALAAQCSKSRFAVEKVQLYQSILDSLCSYHAKSVSEVEILQTLQTLQIMWMKGLAKPAQQLIQKYKKRLYEELDNGTGAGSIIYLLNFIHFEKLNIYSVVPRNQQQAYIQKVLLEYDNAVKMLSESNIVSKLIARTNYLRNDKHCPRNPNLEKDVVSFLEHPFLQENAHYLRRNSEYQCLRIRFHIAKLLKNYEAMFPLIERVLLLLAPIQNDSELNAIYYSLNLVSKMEALLYANSKEVIAELQKAAKEVRAMPEKIGSKEKVPYQIYSHVLETYIYELLYFIRNNDRDGIEKTLASLQQKMAEMPDIVALIKEESSSQNLYFDLYHTQSKAYFALGNYHKAFDYNLHIINQSSSNFMTWDYRKALFFSVLIHFELGNYRVLPYQIEKVEHFLKKIDAPFALEYLICKFLKKIGNCPPQSKEQRALFSSLSTQMLPLLDNPYEQMEQIDFDYWAWVAAHR